MDKEQITKYATLNVNVKEVDNDKYQVRAIFSTPDIDRHGEVVDQLSWKLDSFLQNPVVLFAHDHYQPAIGKVVSIGMVDGNLEGVIQFAAAEYAFARTIFNLYAGGYMKAISVGFSSGNYDYDPENDLITLRDNTLYEVSCVNVPANARALAKAKGIDTSALDKRAEKAERMNAEMFGTQKKVDDEPAPQPTPEPAPETEPTTTEPEEPQAIDAQKALATLLDSDNNTIQAAVKALTGRLNTEPKADTQGEKRSKTHGKKAVAAKKYPVKDVNRVIRSLIEGKRSA